MTRFQPRYDAIDRDAIVGVRFARRVREAARSSGGDPIGGPARDRPVPRLLPSTGSSSEGPVFVFPFVHPWRPIVPPPQCWPEVQQPCPPRPSQPPALAADVESKPCPGSASPAASRSMSWAVPLEGSALEQATNLSNLPFAIDHVALMPDAHAGYGMPIGGVLFAERAVVPYAIGVDIGCGVALVETDLTVETLAPDELDRVLEAIDAGVPTGFQKLAAPVDREVAWPSHRVWSCRTSVKEPWFDQRARRSWARWVVATTSSRSSGTRPAGCSSCSTPVRGAWARRSATSSTSGRSRRTWPGTRTLPAPASSRTCPSARTTSPATGRR